MCVIEREREKENRLEGESTEKSGLERARTERTAEREEEKCKNFFAAIFFCIVAHPLRHLIATRHHHLDCSSIFFLYMGTARRVPVAETRQVHVRVGPVPGAPRPLLSAPLPWSARTSAGGRTRAARAPFHGDEAQIAAKEARILFVPSTAARRGAPTFLPSEYCGCGAMPGRLLARAYLTAEGETKAKSSERRLERSARACTAATGKVVVVVVQRDGQLGGRVQVGPHARHAGPWNPTAFVAHLDGHILRGDSAGIEQSGARGGRPWCGALCKTPAAPRVRARAPMGAPNLGALGDNDAHGRVVFGIRAVPLDGGYTVVTSTRPQRIGRASVRALDRRGTPPRRRRQTDRAASFSAARPARDVGELECTESGGWRRSAVARAVPRTCRNGRGR